MRAMVGAAALSMLGLGAAAKGDDGPIRIGLILYQAGPGAAIGEYLQRGSALAVEQAGAKCSAGRSN